MDLATLVALGVAVFALLGVGVLLVLVTQERRRHSEQLIAQRAQIDELRAERLLATSATRPAPAVAEFLITDVGTRRDDPLEPVDDRLVLSATLGEPLVKVAAFGHGLRRALSPRTLNRIRYEVRREIRRSRRQRRRDMKQAWQESRSEETAA